MNRRERRAQETEQRRRRDQAFRAGQRTIRLAMLNRSCGDCQACCTVMGVTELAKPQGERCRHLEVGGCGIYGSRPESCRDFHCLWRMGLGHQDERPDKTGLVIDVTHGDLPALVIREAWPDAFETSRPMIERLVSEGHLIYLVRGQSRLVLGPPEKVALANQRITLQQDRP